MRHETAEQKYVVKPLEDWFKRQKAKWILQPRKSSTTTGWDIQARRKNQDLLIEAKYIQRSFIGSFSQLVTSPLPRKTQDFMKNKDESWCADKGWAIGSSYKTRNIYQLIFDYFGRNPEFWEHYCQDLKVKYVFFVKENRVGRILFTKLLKIADSYARQTVGMNCNQRRTIADQLMKNLSYT